MEDSMLKNFKVFYRGTGNFEVIEALSAHQAKLFMALRNDLPLNALHRLRAEKI
jgi:hypothetical protein